jgi:serine/threonine protein kinase
MSLRAGSRVGHYEILSPLGRGGMGEVYRARDRRLDRDVAVKILAPRHASDPRFLERFAREARAVAALNHPHVCVLYDVGTTPVADGGELHYLVMEYLEGETLAERLPRGRPAFTDLLRWATDTADALDAAHARGLVHRDVKPANLFLTSVGAIKVLDFGLATLVAGARADAETQAGTGPGTAVGTVGYMSPEQARG